MWSTAWDVLLLFAMIATVAALVWIGIREREQKERCTDNGGTVEEYDCGMVPCGDGCWVESCSWRCVGANAEAR